MALLRKCRESGTEAPVEVRERERGEVPEQERQRAERAAQVKPVPEASVRVAQGPVVPPRQLLELPQQQLEQLQGLLPQAGGGMREQLGQLEGLLRAGGGLEALLARNNRGAAKTTVKSLPSLNVMDVAAGTAPEGNIALAEVTASTDMCVICMEEFKVRSCLQPVDLVRSPYP